MEPESVESWRCSVCKRQHLDRSHAVECCICAGCGVGARVKWRWDRVLHSGGSLCAGCEALFDARVAEAETALPVVAYDGGVLWAFESSWMNATILTRSVSWQGADGSVPLIVHPMPRLKLRSDVVDSVLVRQAGEWGFAAECAGVGFWDSFDGILDLHAELARLVTEAAPALPTVDWKTRVDTKTIQTWADNQ